MNKYVVVFLAALSLAFVSSKTFADGCWFGCYTCDTCCYSSGSDYGYDVYPAYDGYVGVYFP